jgi:hypothetical protein
MNSQTSGRPLSSLPSDTVVFFEAAKPGWNKSGGAELLDSRQEEVAVAFASGMASIVPADEVDALRWSPN